MRYARRRMKESKDTENRPSVVCTPKYALKKLRAGLRLSRWELEEISRDAKCALDYAHHTGSRWSLGEPAIMSSSYSVIYASNVVKGRWFEAESEIMKTPVLALQYARGVLQGRWGDAEDQILSEYDASKTYHKELVGGRWGGFEEKIAKYLGGKRVWPVCWLNRMSVLRDYMKQVRCRVESFEEVLGVVNRPGCLYIYALGIGGRLPGVLHNKMMMMSYSDKGGSWARRYVRFLERNKERVLKYIADLDEDDRRELFGSF